MTPIQNFRHWRVLALLAVVVAALLLNSPTGFEASAQQAVLLPARPSANDAELEPNPLIRREGSSVEFAGVFRVAGERVVFQPLEASEALRVLENLALERIVGVLEDSSSERIWKVNGAVTEYRGANYLLVKRAIVDAPAGGNGASADRPQPNG